MTSTAGVTYTYDGDGMRVKKSNGRLYWYGSGSDPLEESNLSGVASAEFIFFGGKRTARLDLPGAAVHYYFANHLGSATVVTSSAGVIQDESDYYPFGGERVVTDTDPNPYKFTGKERDTESNLDNFGARYYSSQYGRFLSPDEFSGGPVDAFSSGDPLPPGPLPYADISNPQSLNKFTYTRNNPLRWTDPNGHCLSGLIADTVLCYVVGTAAVAGVSAMIYGKWNVFLAKAEEMKAAKEFYGACTQSQRCDVTAAANAANRSYADANVQGLETGVASTPTIGVPTTPGEAFLDAVIEGAKDKAIEDARKKAEAQKQKQEEQQRAEQEKKKKEEEEQRKEEEKKKRKEVPI
jgi:RHS repeat-associated protein